CVMREHEPAGSPAPAIPPAGKPLASDTKIDLVSKPKQSDGYLHIKGHIIPDVGKEVNVAARFQGRIVEVRTTLGQSVQNGAVLAVVSSREISDLEAEML